MNTGMDVLPHPHDVAALVESLVDSEWPTSEAQRLTWFQHHGLDARESRREWGDDGVDSFAGRGPERWGSPRRGWHTCREFVEDPVVQLHVDHTARSDRASEAAAQSTV